MALLYAALLDLDAGDQKSAHRRLQLLEATTPDARAAQLYLARLESEQKPEVAEARLVPLQAEGRFLVETTTLLADIEAARGRKEKALYQRRLALLQDPTYLPARRGLLPQPLPVDR